MAGRAGCYESRRVPEHAMLDARPRRLDVDGRVPEAPIHTSRTRKPVATMTLDSEGMKHVL